MTDSLLGKPTTYPERYAPELLVAIPRSSAREPLGIGDPLSFGGADLWTAWEFTWLDANGKPRVAVLDLRVPAESPNLIESKSLKLYLNGFAMTRYESATSLRQTLRDDLSRVASGSVDVRFDTSTGEEDSIDCLRGECLDDLPITVGDYSDVEPASLAADASHTVEESLHTHLLRSLCPVTGQPDTGSLQLRYRGPAIDRAGLLRYLVSFRQHSDFHEACVERIFCEIRERCGCEALTVQAYYCRRGGIDINPYRTDTAEAPGKLRLWRQ